MPLAQRHGISNSVTRRNRCTAEVFRVVPNPAVSTCSRLRALQASLLNHLVDTQQMRLGDVSPRAFTVLRLTTISNWPASHHGPAQSNGMCLLEFVVHWKLKPNASTEQIVDLPQVTSCPGPVSEPGGFMSCGYFPGRLVGPVRAVGPGLHFASDLRSPAGAVGRDLEGNARALYAPQLPAFGEQRSDESRKSSDLAAENAGKHLRLALVGALVNEDAGRPLSLSRPEIAFPSSHPNEAQTIEIDIAVMALPDVPEQDQLAEAVVRGLGEGAGARRRHSCNCRTSLR